ncbi:MAG: 5-(carboxyamino)imidazole ribonucleotide synthase [Ferrovum sp.]|nr:5-(carboxyamino)imidazole ribonucleotide synthase [Ferrovum sp.]NDU89226.1 5-(carboxyamino)imidazole ribonucleotide synthase [Ferrovum sp.]
MSRRNRTLGLLGGGQLGRMFTSSARTMGFDVWVLDPDPDAPAAHFATRHLCAAFDDAIALKQLADSCRAVTTEFENVPAETLSALASQVIVRPGARAVSIVQDRIREKTFLRDEGFPVGAFALVPNGESCANALTQIKFPALIKTARFGYDGKGQVRVETPEEAREVLSQRPGLLPCILEEIVPLRLEISVILARTAAGEIAYWPVAENRHHQGILDITIAPARIRDELASRARKMAGEIAERLEYVGVMAVEFFVTGIDQILVNEIAPRPHNSGHYTLDACITSQFEQQVRVLCDLPLGSTEQLKPAAMINLLGDLWQEGTPPWLLVFQEPEAKLHLYGKEKPRPGRKMGHITVLGPSANEALERALRLRNALSTTTSPSA